MIVGLVLATLVAAGAGAGLGTILAGNIEAAVTAKVKELPEKPPAPPVKYSGDLVVRDLKPIIANLAAPSTTWIRLETAIIFTNGAVENPDVAASEIEQDLLAYVRTLTLDQLQGRAPSSTSGTTSTSGSRSARGARSANSSSRQW